MKSLILECDFLSVTPQLLFLNKTRASNFLGTTISVLCMIAIFVLGIFFLQDFTNRKKYFLSSADEVVGIANYTLTDFDLVFDLRNGQYKRFEEFNRLVSYKAYQNVMGSPKIERCDPQTKGIKDLGTKYPIDGDFLCLEESYEYNVHKYGAGSYLGIIIMPCVNETLPADAPRCFPLDYIKETLRKDDMFVWMYFKDKTINHTSLTDIFPVYQNMIILKFTMDIMLRYQLKFQPTTYNIDLGRVFEESETQRGYIYTGVDYQVDIPNFSAILPKFGHIDIVLDSTKRTYNRSYIKLQAVAANIGGVAKFCLIIGQVLIYFYSNNLFYYSFAKSIFTEEIKEASCFRNDVILDKERGSSNFNNYIVASSNIDNSNNVMISQTVNNKLNEKVAMSCTYENNDFVSKEASKQKPNFASNNFSSNKQAIIFKNDRSYVTQNRKNDLNFQKKLENLDRKRSKNNTEGTSYIPTFCDFFLFKSKEFKALIKKTDQVLSYDNLLNTISELVSYKNYFSQQNDLIYFGNGIDYHSLVEVNRKEVENKITEGK